MIRTCHYFKPGVGKDIREGGSRYGPPKVVPCKAGVLEHIPQKKKNYLGPRKLDFRHSEANQRFKLSLFF